MSKLYFGFTFFLARFSLRFALKVRSREDFGERRRLGLKISSTLELDESKIIVFGFLKYSIKSLKKDNVYSVDFSNY